MSFFRCCLPVFVATGLLLPAAQAQRVEVVGLAASFNISQSWLREPGLQLGAYQLRGNAGARFDDTGNRFSAYSRIRLGESAFFVQPELAYTSVLSSRYDLSYPGDSGPPSAPGYQPPSSAPFGYRIRRAEVAVLAGWHLSPGFYVVAGPVLARQLREKVTASQSSPDAVYGSLYNAVERQQLLAQLGVGLQVWRLDLGLRYEQSLTPYTRQVTYAGLTQGFHQRTNQFIISAGVLLYDRSRQWRKKG